MNARVDMVFFAVSWLMVAAFPAAATGQQEVWRVWSNTDAYLWPWPYPDFDGDGVTDLIMLVEKNLYTTALSQSGVRILSGRDGSILFERFDGLPAHVVAVGDVDGDGYSEYAQRRSSGGAANLVEVYSPFRDAPLWTVMGPPHSLFGSNIVGLNLDSDPNHEVVTATSAHNDSRVFAYDDDGTLLYTFNMQVPTYQILQGLGAVGDIDGDGYDDFGVGLLEGTGRGAVQLYSGRTGTVLRRDLGPQFGDVIGSQIVSIGDHDGDGVPDYAASNYAGFRGVVVYYSGATGQVLREWSGPQGMAEKLLAGADYDLDGVADVFAGGPRHPNPNGYIGRVQVLSGRDGGLLWDEENGPSTEPGAIYPGDRYLGQGLADIGALPGNPYPLVVVWDWPLKVTAYNSAGVPTATLNSPRLRAFRVALAGTAVTGAGCASTGAPPDIAVRRQPGGLRVTLHGARPGALAWLCVGPDAAVGWHGQPFPIALGGSGFPGCGLQVPADLVFARVTGNTGHDSGYAFVAAPFTPAATGLGIAAQWLTVDPASLDFAMSARHELHIW